jgi:hypothetical protein
MKNIQNSIKLNQSIYYYFFLSNLMDLEKRHFFLTNSKFRFKKQFRGGKIREFNKHNFKFQIDNSEKNATITIDTFEKEPLDCAIVAIDKVIKTANIDNISYYQECAEPYLIKGTHLFDFMMRLITKNKKKYFVNNVTLTDNSEKYIKSCKKKVNFSTYYSLLNGDTWYGSKGFLPAKYDTTLGTYIINELDTKKYNKNKFIIRSKYVKDIKWKDFTDNKKLLKLVSKNENQKLIDFNKILNKDHECLFVEIQETLFEHLHLTDFHSKMFIYFL